MKKREINLIIKIKQKQHMIIVNCRSLDYTFRRRLCKQFYVCPLQGKHGKARHKVKPIGYNPSAPTLSVNRIVPRAVKSILLRLYTAVINFYSPIC